MKMKAEDVQVNDPQKAMERFRAALAKIAKAPKTVFKAKHGTGRAKKTTKR